MTSSDRYPALQGYAKIVKAIAFVTAIGIVIGGAGTAATMYSRDGVPAVIIILAFGIVFAMLAYIAIGASGDVAQLLIDVERHLRRLDTPAADQQTSPPPTP